jgi:type IV pilus assembly protein PilY1
MSKRILVVSGLAVGTLATGAALAQSDTNPAKPNVLLLVDTSGSMEWKSSTAGCPKNQPCFPACQPDQPNDGTNNPNERSRWTELQEVMTGSIQQYSCFAQPRSGPLFTQEFQLGPSGVTPVDLAYENPYHRSLSNRCAPSPGVLPSNSNPYEYPTGAIAYRPYNAGSQSISLNSTCSYGQWRDGLLDAYEGLVRFGLMTFDTSPDAGTGISSGGTADYQTGRDGTWSYYLDATGACRNPGPSGRCMGAPWNCGTLYANEVGARNAAAPPWEGRMVAFGPPAEDGTVRNQWIQEILLATRPYGATPIAGMLSDARNFLWTDASSDPLNSSEKFGPKDDNLIDGTPTAAATGSCRQEYVILLTDGEPNLELRPECINPNNPANDSTCPYATAADIAHDLANPTSDKKKTVRTFVVGFAIGNVKRFTPDGGTQTIDCETMDLKLCDPMPTDRALKACCVLNQIAWAGTPEDLQNQKDEIDHALFPSSAADLRQALDRILRKVSGSFSGRTFPTTSAAPVNDAGRKGYEFSAGADPGDGWRGILKRSRVQCDATGVASVQDVEVEQGDDFAATLNKYPRDRTFFTVVGDVISSIRYPQYSMRPYYSATINDGVGTYSGAQSAYVDPSGLASEIPPEAMSISDATCVSATESLNKTQCRDRIVNWIAGVTTSSTTLPNRCASPGTTSCNVFGDIFHSQPQVRGKPSDLLADDTYTTFTTAQSTRDMLLYVSTNDGFLHSFLLAPGDPVTNPGEIVNRQFAHQERWAFVPPAVLPYFLSMYPGNFTPAGQQPPSATTRLPVLDGTPVIKDVGATQLGTSSSTYPYRLDRKKFADSVAQEIQTWRTMLVEGFGPLQSGFFALDITKPKIVTGDNTAGPKFLWQLTTDDAGNHLFGKTSPTPLITTLFFNTGESGEPIREVAVAVLPGGDGDAPSGGDCAAGTYMTPADNQTKPRATVRCYNSGRSIPARSLTIVRLDTGAIVRTFRPNLPSGLSQPVTFDSNVVQLIDIPSPIVGQPVAYPSQTGQIADRIFVGDKDGRIWRVDVSDTDPKKWTMLVYFDAYYGQAPDKGQPIQTPPLLSVDEKGQITVAFGTGDQDNIVGTDTHYVMSTVETVTTSSGTTTFKPELRWQASYTDGERALGPMTMFARTVYYSTVKPPNPPAGASCAAMQTTSNIRGWDFLLNENTISGTTFPPKPAWKKSATEMETTKDELERQNLSPIRDIPAIVAGVGLRQMPSCSDVKDAVANTDTFLGFGQSTTISTSNPGKFQLVFRPSSSKDKKISSKQESSGVVPLDLTAPNTNVRVDSWAPIIE